MSGDLLTFLAGVVAGAVLSAAILWSRREEVKRARKEPRGEALDEKAPSSVDTGGAPNPRRLRTALAGTAVAFLGCGALAAQAGDSFVRTINLTCCVIFAIATLALAERE